MPDIIRLGIMGCGNLGTSVHLKLLSEMPKVRIGAVAERDPARLERARSLVPGAETFARFEDLIEKDDLDAVVICLPDPLHAEAAQRALLKGKHVYLEKPMALNSNQAHGILDLWTRGNRVGMMGFNYRFNPLYQELKSKLREGLLGRVVSARTFFSTPLHSIPPWQAEELKEGGVLYQLASHHMDLIRFLLDQEICEVSARLWTHQVEQDSAALEFKLENGSVIQSLFLQSAADDHRFEIYGERGKLAVNLYSSCEVEFQEPLYGLGARLKKIKSFFTPLARASYIVEKLRSPRHEPSYQKALTCFVEAVRSGQQVQPDFWDGYQNLKVIEAAKQSAKTGSVVSLSKDREGRMRAKEPVR